MNYLQEKRLWFYPILFGFLGAFLGLLIRFFFTKTALEFPLKNIIHSHSHVMLLGFLFNGLIVLLWKHFSKGIDAISYKYFIALQVCAGCMLVAFILQGYALFSILFSTLHLWISYIFLVRLWKSLKGNKQLVYLIKLGVVFHFVASIGPYCLGPLMILDLQQSPWYQQAIFFYLHFQYFGAFFVWLLAIFFKQTTVRITNKHILLIGLSLIGLYAHSLDYNFNHWLIQVVGGISSILLLLVLLSYIPFIKGSKKVYQFLYGILLIIGVCNIAGSFPIIASLIINNHYILIGWLHFLFLGLFVPYIWIESPIKINSFVWIVYCLFAVLSEALLIFPNVAFKLFKTPITWLLLIAYFGVFICFSIVHLKFLLKKTRN